MASMREIKLRIKSIQDTRQITKAMKLIATSKLRRARKQLDQSAPYFEMTMDTMKDILVHSADIHYRYFDTRQDKETAKKGYIIITSDKGLAGGYNHNIIRLAEENVGDDPNTKLFVLGYVGRNYFLKKNLEIDKKFDFTDNNPTIFTARDIAEQMLKLYLKEDLDEIYVVYTRMYSSVKLVPKVIRLLPLEHEHFLGKKEELPHPDELFKYHPSPEKVFDVLVGKYLKGIIYGTLVESFTSEQSARMSAMDNATTNADEMLGKLKLHYNRARQAAITQEVSEIVAGAAALNQ